jgi:hypothetical protein
MSEAPKHGAEMEPLDDAVDHVRGGSARAPHRRVRRLRMPVLARSVSGRSNASSDGWAMAVRFAFRHFPLTEVHPHALAAAAAAEAAALQNQFWNMHELLFHRQTELEDDDLRAYAGELGSTSRCSTATESARRCSSAFAAMWRAESRRVRYWARPPCSSTDVVYRGDYGAATLLEAIGGP